MGNEEDPGLMLIRTAKCVFAVHEGDASDPVLLHEADGIRRVASVRNGAVVALADGSLVLLGKGSPKTVQTTLEGPIASLLSVRNDLLTVLIGTDEGAHVYRLSGDDGLVERLEAFDRLDCRDGWHTPWGGPPAVRSLAATRDSYVYADVQAV